VSREKFRPRQAEEVGHMAIVPDNFWADFCVFTFVTGFSALSRESFVVRDNPGFIERTWS
jgi:hypothetical protein